MKCGSCILHIVSCLCWLCVFSFCSDSSSGGGGGGKWWREFLELVLCFFLFVFASLLYCILSQVVLFKVSALPPRVVSRVEEEEEAIVTMSDPQPRRP